MSEPAPGGVTMATVAADEEGIRLDRWFRRRYPDLTHGRLEKLLRTGQVRVDGKRAKSNFRLAEGQTVRVPPLAGGRPAGENEDQDVKSHPAVSDKDARELAARVLFMDDDVIALDKPPGLPVQGGTGTTRHLDGMLDTLRFGAERPRLVHRLDKDTSGVLLLARTARAAARLAAAFRNRSARKVYWAITVGIPEQYEGRIDIPLAKVGGAAGERVAADEEDGQRAVTRYRLVEKAGRRAAWLVFEPETGRTHQLRVHAAALGTPILGDGKYGGREAFIRGGNISAKLHLHARAIRIDHPRGGVIEVAAPLPRHMAETWRFLGFEAGQESHPFGDGRLLFPEGE